RDDELAVISEFNCLALTAGYDCRLLSAEEVLARSPAARGAGLKGGLLSAAGLCVDPREGVARMPAWLMGQFEVQYYPGASINRVSGRAITAANGDRWVVDEAIIAAGADFKLLYPELYASARFRRCKLQMMRTVPQPKGWRLGPMVAGGLTLRHY